MTTTAGTATKLRLVGLDGLRGILALCVIIVHVVAHFSPTILARTHLDVLGQAIVIFFVLSGMLIYMPFARAIIAGADPLGRIRSYAKSRLLRVFPVYLVIFTIANLTGTLYVENAMVVQSEGGTGGAGSITEPIPLLLHATLLQNYAPGELQTGINSSWTLTTELAFYLILPFVAALTAAAFARWAPAVPRYVVALAPGVLLILVGTVSRIALAIAATRSDLSSEMGEWGPNLLAVLSRSILPWSDNFGWGMLGIVLFLALRDGTLPMSRVVPLRRLAWVVAVVFLGVSAACYLVAPRFIAAAFAIFSIALLLLLVMPSRPDGRVWTVSRIVDNPVLHWLGTTSLSIYLWHYPVILWFERSGLAGGDDLPGLLGNFAIVSAISIALGSISYLTVEKLAMALAKR